MDCGGDLTFLTRGSEPKLGFPNGPLFVAGSCVTGGGGGGAAFAMAASAERMDAASGGFAAAAGVSTMSGHLICSIPLIGFDKAGGGGGVPVGVVDPSWSFLRASRIISSGKVLHRCQISNNFLILSYSSRGISVPF